MNCRVAESPIGPARDGMTEVDGVRIAYYVRGSGPPLVLIIGFRLHADAWPAGFIEELARRFTVVMIDNRGTGNSEKPVHGYALSNMANDVIGVLDSLGIDQAYAMGYSMGGGIAQELACQHPDRIIGLVLCATLCGGTATVRAPLSILRVLRDVDGYRPDEVGRRIWSVTYAPDYLLKHRDRAERQLQREILRPTPLHVADLQFQALSEFDTSAKLPELRIPTLVLTGDLDQLVLPHNSTILFDLIPEAVLRIVQGCGHRLMWEEPVQCATIIADFLQECGTAEDGDPAVEGGRPTLELARERPHDRSDIVSIRQDSLWRSMGRLLAWPATVEDIAVDFVTKTVYTACFGGRLHFGDGKPVVLVPPLFVGDLALSGFAAWLKSIGYRPSGVGFLPNLDSRAMDRAVAEAVRKAVHRIGRKAVVIAFGNGFEAVSRVANSDEISDVIVLGIASEPAPALSGEIRLHVLRCAPSADPFDNTSETRRLDGWPFPVAMLQSTFITISDILYGTPIELRGFAPSEPDPIAAISPRQRPSGVDDVAPSRSRHGDPERSALAAQPGKS